MCAESASEQRRTRGTRSLEPTLDARPHRHPARKVFIAALIFLLLRPYSASAADLEPDTIAAFNHYAQLAEAQIDSELARGEPFLWVERLPEIRREAAFKE